MEDQFQTMLIQRIAHMQTMLSRERSRSRAARKSRDAWKRRAREAGASWREGPLLRARIVKLEKALERERFLNSMSRMNQKRREAA
jgi:hypothetical protein